MFMKNNENLIINNSKLIDIKKKKYDYLIDYVLT